MANLVNIFKESPSQDIQVEASADDEAESSVLRSQEERRQLLQQAIDLKKNREEANENLVPRKHRNGCYPVLVGKNVQHNFEVKENEEWHYFKGKVLEALGDITRFD